MKKDKLKFYCRFCNNFLPSPSSEYRDSCYLPVTNRVTGIVSKKVKDPMWLNWNNRCKYYSHKERE